mgnify:CR=1 FL=1
MLPDSDEANNTLSFEDMLLLMVTQLQLALLMLSPSVRVGLLEVLLLALLTPLDFYADLLLAVAADTNDMMNQIIQMTVMQAITEMSSKVDDMTEANILN